MSLARVIPFCVVTITLMSGCGTTPAGCDPSRADFFNNTACLAGGAYAERQARLERDLSRERRLNRDFHAVYAALQEEQAALQARRRTATSRYGELDRAWQDLQDELRRSHGEKRNLTRRIEEIDRDLAGRNAPSAGNDLRAKEQRRADLQRKIDLLHQELEAGIYD